MIINRIQLENWKVFDNKEFEFTPGVNIVKGDNYSGKTSFIQALYFAMFNESMYKQLTAKELKKEGQRNATIVFDFTTEGKKYRIRRNIGGLKIVKTDSYLYRLENGVEVEELESISKKSEELTKIEEILKISRDFVKNVNFIQEDSIPQLLNNPKSKIMDDIFNILQLDYFTKINDYATNLVKELEKKISQLEGEYSSVLASFDIIKSEIKDIKAKNEKLRQTQNALIKDIEVIDKKIENYGEIENLHQKISSDGKSIQNEQEKKNLLLSDIEERRTELRTIEKIENDLRNLELKSKQYLQSESELERLKSNLQDSQKKLNIIQQTDILLKDKRSRLAALEAQLADLNEVISDFKNVQLKMEELEAKSKEYNNVLSDIEKIQNKIENEKHILENFKEGTCPITKSDCPVSNQFIEQYSQSLERLRQDKQNCVEKLSQIDDPTEELNKIIKEKEKLVRISEQKEDIIGNINTLQQEIKAILKEDEGEKKLKAEIDLLEGKIKTLSEEITNLKKDHEMYLINKDKVKEKERIVNWIKDKEELLKKTDLLIENIKKQVNKHNENIQEYKRKHNIEDFSELEKIERDRATKKTEFEEIKFEIKKNEYQVEEKEKSIAKLLSPYESPEEMLGEIEKLVHENYKVIFFQDALLLTLEEIKTRKLKSIKDQCNKLWSKFHTDSVRHLIDWDENFLPVLQIGGIPRNLYQLSSSEKMFIYFSIRSALLSELGPNRFIVVDNLLNPFMIENQKIILEQLKKIIDETEIEQIIITGFDISSDLKVDNLISL